MPAGALGADLVWWRSGPRWRTLVTISGRMWASQLGCEEIVLTFAWFDAGGRFCASCARPMQASETLFVDSRNIGQLLGHEAFALPEDGVLAIYVVAPRAPMDLAATYRRLMTLADWLTSDGEIVSLHNDQSVVRGEHTIGLTEIVVRETAEERVSLVIANGPEEQDAGAVELEIRNQRGEVRRASYTQPMPPFSLHRIRLGDLFPGLADFCGGAHATVKGRFRARRLFCRPWVVTEGRRTSAYHGGDVYDFAPIPGGLFNALPYAPRIPQKLARFLGRAEMNPAAAVHLPGRLTTTINLLNTHGALDEDFWIDLRLHGSAGTRVADRPRYRVARRHGLQRIELAEILPDPASPFVGHFALRYASDGRAAYPRRLQALMEYRSPESAARSMLWSDRWNTPERVREQGHGYKALYRAFVEPPRRSHVVVSNCAVHPRYDLDAPYAVILEDGRGRARSFEGVLPPHGTAMHALDDLFPNAAPWLGEQPAGVVIVESAFDLASMHLTEDTTSGVWAAEHLMAVQEEIDGRWYSPVGG